MVARQGYQDAPPISFGPPSCPGVAQVLRVFYFCKTYVEKIPGPFEFAKVPQSEKYEKLSFPPCRVIIQIKGIF
jgi:hypothetical protein